MFTKLQNWILGEDGKPPAVSKAGATAGGGGGGDITGRSSEPGAKGSLKEPPVDRNTWTTSTTTTTTTGGGKPLSTPTGGATPHVKGPGFGSPISQSQSQQSSASSMPSSATKSVDSSNNKPNFSRSVSSPAVKGSAAGGVTSPSAPVPIIANTSCIGNNINNNNNNRNSTGSIVMPTAGKDAPPSVFRTGNHQPKEELIGGGELELDEDDENGDGAHEHDDADDLDDDDETNANAATKAYGGGGGGGGAATSSAAAAGVSTREGKKPLSIDSFHKICGLGKGAFGKVDLMQKKDSKSIYAMKIYSKKKVREIKATSGTLAERHILEKINNQFLVHLHYAFQVS